MDFDVLIAGAGPAGAAAAISLADFAPSLSVCIADAPATDALRVGETLPPQIKPILEHLERVAGVRGGPSSAVISHRERLGRARAR